MAREAEACDIGHGIGVGGKDFGGVVQWAQHLGVSVGDDFAHQRAGQICVGHFGGKDGAGANGFGQDQNIAGFCACFGDGAGGQARDGETDGQFGALRGVAADKICPGGGDHLGRACHDLAQGFGLQGGAERRQGDLRKGDLRRGAHGPDVAKRMGRGDFGHQVGVMGEGAQMVGGDDLQACAVRQDGGIIAGAGDAHRGVWGRAGWQGHWSGRMTRLSRRNRHKGVFAAGFRSGRGRRFAVLAALGMAG